MRKELLSLMFSLYCALQAAEYKAIESFFSSQWGSKSINCMVGKSFFMVVKNNSNNPMCDEHLVAMILGENQQRQLQECNLNDSMMVGKVSLVEHKTLYFMPKESDSYSDDDNYHYFRQRDAALWKSARSKKLQCNLFHVIEPRIVYGVFKEEPGYFPVMQSCEHPDIYLHTHFFGDEAYKRAAYDLSLCYANVLNKAFKYVDNQEKKTIGIDSLGTQVGLPRKEAIPIAFEAIVDFLKKHNGDCNVLLFIKKRSELDMYKELMEKHG